MSTVIQEKTKYTKKKDLKFFLDKIDVKIFRAVISELGFNYSSTNIAHIVTIENAFKRGLAPLYAGININELRAYGNLSGKLIQHEMGDNFYLPYSYHCLINSWISWFAWYEWQKDGNRGVNFRIGKEAFNTYLEGLTIRIEATNINDTEVFQQGLNRLLSYGYKLSE